MDPESGTFVDSPVNRGGSEESRSVVQNLLDAVLRRLRNLLEVLQPQRNVGVENRFYFDEVEKVWKLQGGETETERAEAEAIRFHTSRGLTQSLAPATTACDSSRGDWSSTRAAPLPPPVGGPVTQSRLHGKTAGFDMASLAHPVYAPQGMAMPDATPPLAPPPRTAAPTRPAVQSNPFAPQARTSPFGLANNVQQQPCGALQAPFGHQPVISTPPPFMTAGPGQDTALARPFQH